MKGKDNVTEKGNDESDEKKHRLVLPYRGDKGTHILRSRKKYVRTA